MTFRSQTTMHASTACRPARRCLPWAGAAGRVLTAAVVGGVLMLTSLHGQDRSGADGERAQAPFTGANAAVDARVAADLGWQLELADSALRGGFHSLAERMYQQVLAQPEADGATRRRAAFGQIDAMIGSGRGDLAAVALDAMPEPREAGWRLRRGIAHYLAGMAARSPAETQRELDLMSEQVRDLQAEAVAPDAAWLFFLRGVLAGRAGDQGQADQFFERAVAEASSEAERAVLRLARFQAALSAPEVSEASAAALQANIERQQGKALGFQFTLPYAVVLDRLGNRARAIAVLKRQREIIPASEVELRDQTLLLLGLIAGAGSEDGRQAMRELLEHGRDPDFQRIALMRLAAAARVDSAAGATALRRLITTLLERPAPHPLTEDLLFFRAELALRARAFEEAENDARALLTRFPGSNRLRREALGILASSSWQRPPRYRTAADFISQMQALPEVLPEDRARLALLKGECYIRAGRQDGTAEDFRNAAEAYASIQASGLVPEGVTPGVLFFQRVYALINARQIEAAMRLLDDPAARAGVDAESWWQAEWNLSRELQLVGRGAEAIQRADAMGPAVGVPAELQLRFLWLAAQVSLDGGRPEDTEARVARVRAFVEGPQGADIPAARRADVLANASLVAAEARLRAGDRDGARAAIDRLRAEFAGSPAADYSYIVEAGFLAGENRLVEAMQLLSRFADTRQDSRYAPEALYQAALLSIQRGQKEHLDEANRLLDQMADRYRNQNYIFQARLKQAEVKLGLGSFSEAEAIYRSLEDQYPDHGDRPVVQMSLAGALMAQATVEPAKFDGAVSRFERIMANESLPVDLRVEAGARLAEGWQAQGNSARAAEICWEVYHRFVEKPGVTLRFGATGPSWVSRAMFLLGEIEERAGRPDNARRLYQALLDHDLPGDKIARAKLAKLTAPAGAGI